MRVNLDMARINYQPFKIGFIYQCFQQTFPNAFVSPSAKATMCVLPVAVIWRQISPWRACAKNPEHGIDELPIVAGISSPRPFATKQTRFQKTPNVIRYVVPPMRWFHKRTPCFTGVYR
jgi:hypothetical protein